MDFDVVPYEDIEWGARIGGGSFGSVYKGEYLGQEIAVKEVHMSKQYDVQKYFEREWRIMREARHPNIVLFMGLTSDTDVNGDGRVFIVSEYVPGGNLRNFIKSNAPFPWSMRISFATDVARAVAYLHARQCLHRDLKGENLLITSNHRLKLGDFGFARITGRNAEELKHMTYCGTDGYMSPEIIMGEPFDLPTDVYSLGIIFIELATRILVGTKVYVRQAPTFTPDADTVRARASPGCPPAFVALALQCCRFLPEERPTMPDILRRLRDIERGLPAEGDEPVPHPGSVKVAKRDPKRPIPIFDVAFNTDSEDDDARPAAKVAKVHPSDIDADQRSLDSIAQAAIVVDGAGPTTPCRNKSIPWDEMTSEYLAASEMRDYEPLFGSDSDKTSAAPSPLDATEIRSREPSPMKPMPCAYPPQLALRLNADPGRGPDSVSDRDAGEEEGGNEDDDEAPGSTRTIRGRSPSVQLQPSPRRELDPGQDLERGEKRGRELSQERVQGEECSTSAERSTSPDRSTSPERQCPERPVSPDDQNAERELEPEPASPRTPTAAPDVALTATAHSPPAPEPAPRTALAPAPEPQARQTSHRNSFGTWRAGHARRLSRPHTLAPAPSTLCGTATHRFSIVHRDPLALLSGAWMAAQLALTFFPRPTTPRDVKERCSVCVRRLASRMALQCDDCGIVVHPKCSDAAPRNCVVDIGVDP